MVALVAGSTPVLVTVIVYVISRSGTIWSWSADLLTIRSAPADPAVAVDSTAPISTVPLRMRGKPAPRWSFAKALLL